MTGALDANGNNSIYIAFATLGALSVNLGSGNDLYTQQLCTVNGNCNVDLGDGQNKAYFAGLDSSGTFANVIAGTFTVKAGSGDDLLIVDTMKATMPVLLDGGAGFDTLGIRNSNLPSGASLQLLNFELTYPLSSSMSN